MRIKVLSGGRKGIELPLSDAGLNFQMRRIDIEETVPMCRLVEVSEQDNPLHHFEGQTVNMDEVNFFAKRMESLTEYERKVLSAYAEDYGVATMQDLINLTFSMKGLSLLTDFSDVRQVGVRLYMDEFLWTNVISLRREDAERLGYDNAAQWQALLRSRVELLCENYKIDSRNLKWYAAFHNESHHPHVHLVVYSTNPSEGYLSTVI